MEYSVATIVVQIAKIDKAIMNIVTSRKNPEDREPIEY